MNSKDNGFKKGNLYLIGEILIFSLLFLGIAMSVFYNYLIFHSFAEIFSVVIMGGIFIIGWNTREYSDSSFFLIIGISSAYIGFFDLIHTLAYKGMNLFIGYDSNLPTQLWISARYLQSISLIVAILLSGKKINEKYFLIGYSLISSLLMVLIFFNLFPVCYIEGRGLTNFKIISEYIIIAILSLSCIILYRVRKKFDKNIFLLLIIANIFMIFSELSFTFYIDVFGIFNYVGHLLKILQFYLIYKGIIQISLRHPIRSLFRKIKKDEQNLRESYQRTNFYKDLFTHDISNIIQNFKISLSVLQERILNKNLINEDNVNQKLLENLKSQINRGVNLIENVRKLSEIDNQSIVLSKINVLEYLDKSIEFVKNSFERKEIKITKEIKTENFMISANDLIQEVFENILTNAIIHNEHDFIEINVIINDSPDKPKDLLRIEFKDNGIGVPDEKKKIIFKEGYKEEKSPKGMGLGLSLVVKILNLFNGVIWVDDRILDDHNKGSNFIIEIPKMT
jgi:signal transduction histidine kinase